MKLLEAKAIAIEKCYALQPYCSKVNIAGSVRRLAPDVKDIEVVCTPKYDEHENADLFGALTTVKVLSQGFVKVFNSLGEVVKGKANGRYAQIKLPEGINLDLFMPEVNDYYRQYAIRTGSAEYASYVIAHGWRVNGWVGTENGLRKQSQCLEKKLPDGKSKWICEHPNPSVPPVWENEESFFKWLGVPYRHPKDRIM